MKTIRGNGFSTKPISLSKAAKFLSNFVSSENGASQAINAYLHRASSFFNELKKVHKDLNSSYSDKKHKRHGPEASHVSEAIGENPIRSVEISQERSKNKSRRHQFLSNTVEDEEKPARSVVEFSQEPNAVVKYNESGSEKQKKKKNREVESRDHPERKDEGKLTKSKESLAWDVESGQKQGNGGRDIMGMEEGNKHKGEKKKRKEKDSISNISHTEAEIGNLEGKGTMGAGDQKGTENKPNSRGVENGGLVDTQELHSKKKRRYEAGSENKINAQEEKREQKTKRKNEEVEDRTEESNGRRKRRKREGDD